MLYNPKYPEIQFFAKMKIFWDFVLHVLHDQREISENSADFVLFRFESEKHYLQILILKCEWKYPSHMNDSFMRSKNIEIKACIDIILMFGINVSAAINEAFDFVWDYSFERPAVSTLEGSDVYLAY